MPITKAKTDSSKLISLMFIIGRRLREQMRQAAKDQSCSLLHFEALQYVDDWGKPLMRDVAEHFMITPPAATLLVEGLVAEKLLTRSFDQKDRRAVRISITKKGKQVLARGVEERMQKIRQIFSVLNTDERVELARILEKIGKTKHI